jgi:hypothetical protein
MIDPVSRRLVFLFPGFEPMQAADHVGRLRHGAEKTAAAFDVSLTLDHAEPARAGTFLSDTRWTGEGAGWRTETDMVLCGWGDLVLDYAARPTRRRLAAGLAALGDFLVGGTFLRYCRTSWRYALFFLFPILLLTLIGAAGLLLASLPAWLGLSLPHALWSVPLAALAVVLLFGRADKRFHLLVALDDWAMAADLCRGRSAALRARVAAFADMLTARMARTQADEVLVAAHSLGASFAVLALAEALERAGGAPAHLGILTVGSSLMKTALHPAASGQRAAVEALVSRHRLPWLDVQAITDPINFYRSNPAGSLGIAAGRVPTTMRISLSKLLFPQTFARIRLNFFRLHRQFVLGNERRRPYAFHMILFGPVSFPRVVEARSVDLPPLRPAAGEAPAR